MKRIIVAICLITILSACSDPKNVALPSDPTKWDQTVKDAIKKLSEDEQKLLAGYAFRHTVGTAFGGEGIPSDATIGAAIKAQKDWLDRQKAAQAEQEELKAKVATQMAEFKKLVEQSVVVTVVEKSVLPKDYQQNHFSERQKIILGIENKSAKDMAGIAGSVKFFDIFDKEVGEISFSYDDGLAAGKRTAWTGVRKINMFDDDHKNLAALSEGKYTTKFFPTMIVFSDGTKLKPQ